MLIRPRTEKHCQTHRQTRVCAHARPALDLLKYRVIRVQASPSVNMNLRFRSRRTENRGGPRAAEPDRASLRALRFARRTGRNVQSCGARYRRHILGDSDPKSCRSILRS